MLVQFLGSGGFVLKMPALTKHLHLQLKTQGKVEIPQVTAASLFSKFSFPIAIALLGVGLLWIVPDSSHYGPLLVAISMFSAAIIVFWMEIRDLPRRLTVTPQALRFGRHQPIPWSDIEKIDTPVSHGFLSIHLSVGGYLHYEGDTLPGDDTLDFLQNSEDRVIVWELLDPVSPEELRFLRDQLNGRT